MDAQDEHLGEAVELVQQNFARELEDIFKKERWDRAICFFEFLGPNSFAGQHKDEPHEVVLIDVNPHRKGIEPPREFVKKFGHLNIAKCLHVGTVGPELERTIRNSELEGITSEGVVCKGVRKGRHLDMFKIKTKKWLDKLKDFCQDDEALFNRLM